MANMSYCRFQNTLKDLKDCSTHMGEAESVIEATAQLKLYQLCNRIIEENDEKEEGETWINKSVISGLKNLNVDCRWDIAVRTRMLFRNLLNIRAHVRLLGIVTIAPVR